MAVSIQDYINYLQTFTRLEPRVRVQFLRQDETVESEITADVLGGSLTINRANGVRRAVSVEFANINGQFNPDIDGVWVNRKFKLFLGYRINGEDFLLPQGVFVMTNPKYNSSPNSTRATLNGVDKFSLLDGKNGGYLNNVYIINAGTNPNTAIRALLNVYDDDVPPVLDPITTNTPYDIRKNYDDTAKSVLDELQFMTSRNIFYDEEGRLTFRRDVDDNQKGSLFDFDDNSSGSLRYGYLGSEREADFSKVYNVVKVIGDNINGSIVSAEARDTNPLSSTNVNRIGEKPHKPITQSIIQTTQQAQDLADYILKRSIVLNNLVTITCIPMFHLDVDEIITLTDRQHGFERQRFLINSLSIPLTVGGTMSISAVSADEIDFRTSA